MADAGDGSDYKILKVTIQNNFERKVIDVCTIEKSNGYRLATSFKEEGVLYLIFELQ